MKKTFVLLTIVLALLAAPVFAEVAFSGEANFGISSDFAAAGDIGTDGKVGFKGTVDKLKLGVTGNVDEFTTVTFDLGFKGQYGKDFKGDKGSVSLAPKFTVKTDVTGAMGLELPVAVTLITGKNDAFGTKAFTSGDGYAMNDFTDKNSGDHWNIGADVKILDMVTVRFGMNAWAQESEDYLNGMFVGAFVDDLNGLSAEVFYIAAAPVDLDSTEVTTTAGDKLQVPLSTKANIFGLDAAYKLAIDNMTITPSASFMMTLYNKDMSTVGYDFEYKGNTEKKALGYLDGKLISYGFGVNFEMDALNAGLSLGGGKYDDEDAALGLGFDAGYQINEMFKVYAGLKFADLMADNMYFTNKTASDDGAKANAGADFGVKMSLGAANYFVGYQLGAGKLNNLTKNEGMYLAVKVKF